MTWTAPWALLLAAPLALLLWWRWRRRGERYLPVSTLRIWRLLQQENLSTARERRRMPLRFLVETTTALAFVVALAGPRLPVAGEVLVLVDATGSMSTPGRRREAADRVEELKRAHESIRVLHMRQGTGRPDQRTFWDEALVRAGWRGGPVVVVGDNLPPLDELPRRAAAYVMDAEVDNAGLLAAEVMRRQDRVTVFVSLGVTAMAARTPRTLRLEDGRGVVVHEQVLPAAEAGTHGVTWDMPLPRSDTLRLVLQPEDDWPQDNVLLLSRRREDAGIMLMLPPQALPLGEALQDACAALGRRLRLSGEGGDDVVRLTLGEGPRGRGPAVVFASRRWPVQDLQAAGSVRFKGALQEVPGLAGWDFKKGFQLPQDSAVLPLAEAQGLALLVWDRQGQRIHAADDPAARGWVDEAGFPFLLRALLDTLGPGNEAAPGKWQLVEDKDAARPDPQETLAQVSASVQRDLPPGAQETRSKAWWLVVAGILMLVLLVVDDRRGILS